jgi:carbon storage regulator
MDGEPNSSNQPRECFMLVLTRKLQEKIQIGDGITITVLRTKGKSVRLGIEAPMEVLVIRGELAFGHTADAPHEEEVAATVAATSTDAGRGVAKAARTMPTWDADYLPTDRLPGTAKQVSLQRVPRAQVAQAIAAAPVHGGPLRAMLERRSLTA